jgi:hypothetical protein
VIVSSFQQINDISSSLFQTFNWSMKCF